MKNPKSEVEKEGERASKKDMELLEKSGLSPALKRTIREKLERGELDEIDRNVFEENLRKTVKKCD